MIIKFKKGRLDLGQQENIGKLNSFIGKHNSLLGKVKGLDFANSATFKLNTNNAKAVAEALKNDPDVETAIPNYVFEFNSGTDDPYYEDGSLWALNNTTNGKDIQADEAWDITTGGTTKIVALLDTGVSYNHPDLSANMWDGSDCVDENGDVLGDCIHGYDFVNGDKDPADDYGHGTAMAGIIAAVGNNDEGVTGVNQTASIMAVKVGNSYGAFDDIIAGIQFAQQNGASIINASFGGQNVEWNDYSGMQDAIEDFVEDGLFIAAAGNGKNDNDETGIFPSGFTFDNIISVAATDSNDDFAEDEGGWGSNWGEESVDLFAPGVGIWSTGIQNRTSITIDPNTEITKNSPWNESDNLLFTNTGAYSADTDTSAITDEIDLSGSIDEDSAAISFTAWCDTEPEGAKASPPDYIQVSVRKDAGAWSAPLDSATHAESKINEELLKIPSVEFSYLGAKNTFGAIIPSAYLDETTQFKFEWHTDSNDVGGPYRGCYLEDITVSFLADGETGTSSTSYLSGGGTSASAAYTSGVTALVWNAYTGLTADQVRQIILESGDDINNEHPVTSAQLTVTGKRLNAYRALVMAKQVDNEQVIVLNPTIHSKAAGGNWSTTGTWVEGRVPNSSDVVEINGNVSLDANATIVGLLVNSGFTFKPTSGGDRTLTVSGSLVNNGTIQNNTAYLYLNIAQGLENNGSMTNREAYVDGSMINTSTFSPTGTGSTLAGNLTNTGTISNTIKLDGASTQTIDSTGTISGALTVDSSTTLAHSTTLAGPLTVNTAKTLTIGGSDTLTANNTLTNSGTITGGAIVLGGGAQSWGGNGTYNIASLTLGGTGAKSLGSNTTINGDVTVNSGVTLQPVSSNYTLAVSGDLVNNGTIQNSTPWLYVNISGNLENNGTMSNRTTTVSGNATNSSTGTLSMAGTPNNISGDLSNTGSITASITFNGASTQTLDSTGTISGTVTIGNNTTLAHSTTLAGPLTINTAKTLTIGGSDTLTANNTLTNSGTITGGAIVLGGGAQSWSGAGVHNIASVTLGGTGTKTIGNITMNGDLTVNSGITLQPGGANTNLILSGDLVNNGTIQNSAAYLSLYIGSDWDNNGTMNQYRTYADWEPVGGANSYDFQYTNTSDVWQTAVSTGTNTYYNITSYKNDVRKWRWRSVTGGTPSAWSADHLIN